MSWKNDIGLILKGFKINHNSNDSLSFFIFILKLLYFVELILYFFFLNVHSLYFHTRNDTANWYEFLFFISTNWPGISSHNARRTACLVDSVENNLCDIRYLPVNRTLNFIDLLHYCCFGFVYYSLFSLKMKSLISTISTLYVYFLQYYIHKCK